MTEATNPFNTYLTFTITDLPTFDPIVYVNETYACKKIRKSKYRNITPKKKKRK